MVKLLGKLILSILSIALLFFALYGIFCALIPSMQNGANFFEAIGDIAVSLFNSVKALIGL